MLWGPRRRPARGLGVLAAGAVWGAVVSAAAQPAKEPPAILALLVDSSASLAGSDLDRARALASELLASLPRGSEAAVFSFDDQARLLQPRTADVEDVRAALSRVQIGGRFTALNDALYDASRYLGEAPGRRKAIVLLSDGHDENSALQLDDALKLAQQASIPVFALGVGQVRERVLRRIAKLTGGEYVPAASASGAAIAARIQALPVASATARAAGTAPSPEAGPAPAAESGRPDPGPSRGNGLLMGAIAAALLVAATFGVLALRRRPAASDATDADAADPAEADALAPPGPRERAAALSETVVGRLDLTEEYLEKTVTLREEPALHVTGGPASGVTFFLSRTSTTSLGRSKANDIVLEDVAVSSQHCRVRPEAGSFVLLDLRSTNGTYVNDQRVSRQPLAPGDVIRVGETSLQFRMATRKP